MIYDLAKLFARDLNKVTKQIQAFEEERQLWMVLPGVANSAGNLVLHLEGNLREYVGRQLGGIVYTRNRPREFENTPVAASDLLQRIEHVTAIVPLVIESLTEPKLSAIFPENVLGSEMTVRFFLIHLHGHLNYHLGQIDYLRRILTTGKALGPN